MAEAHQGVAFSFAVTEDEGLHLNVSYEAVKAVLRSGLRNWRKKLSRFVNSVLNGVYPSHPSRGVLVIAIITCLKRYKQKDVSFGLIGSIQNKIPKVFKLRSDTAEVVACITFGTGLWLSYVIIHKYSLLALFSYHGWMYEVHGKPTLKTKLWMGILRLIVGKNPQLYSNQGSMPYLPVPPLDKTMTRYLRTVKPLLDDETYKRFESEAKEFQKSIGKRLQRYLIFKSWISSNYVSDWWEEYIYLRGRSPIMVNSNYYGLDTLYYVPTSVQAARAANCVHAAFLYRRELDEERLTPMLIQGVVPLCSRQYERQFNTTRIPGEVTDKLVHLPDSKHIAVYSKSKWYKLFVYYQSTLLNPKELETQFQRILDDETEAQEGEKLLAALTAGDRIPWAQTRKEFFSAGINKASLDSIEKSAFVVILDEEEQNLIPSTDKGPCNFNEDRQVDKYARSIIHGKGYDRWFDKSFNMIFSKNGKLALNTEHSWADAPISGHLWEYVLCEDITKLKYDDLGHTNGTIRFNLPDPVKLKWDIKPACMERIKNSLSVATALLNDVDLHLYIHDMFGKGIAKKFKMSPDAFVQMALQLAYFRDIGRHNLTYESSMTRLFREGRTETVRSCSIESCDWVKSMHNDSKTVQERASLLRKACDYHQQLYRDAMTGSGIDRHLFCLYVISRYLEVDSPFLKEILSEPWRLSTSQTPSNQTNKIDSKKYPYIISCGGGFGPVADDGYGVSYIITGEDTIFFHISSKKSSDKTDSYRFGQQIRRALIDIKSLLEQDLALKGTKSSSAKQN